MFPTYLGIVLMVVAGARLSCYRAPVGGAYGALSNIFAWAVRIILLADAMWLADSVNIIGRLNGIVGS